MLAIIAPRLKHLSSMPFIYGLIFVVSLGLSSSGHAYALADAALLKFYGGIIRPEKTTDYFGGGSGAAAAFGFDSNRQADVVNLDYDDGVMYGVAIEYFFADHWSLELSLERHEVDLESSSFGRSDDAMFTRPIEKDDLNFDIYALNLYYNFGPIGQSKIQPYLGIGYLQADKSEIKIGSITFENDGQNGVQYIAGFARQITSAWNFFIDYRNISLSKVDLGHGTGGTIRDITYDTETILIGLSVEF